MAALGSQQPSPVQGQELQGGIVCEGRGERGAVAGLGARWGLGSPFHEKMGIAVRGRTRKELAQQSCPAEQEDI